MAITKTYIHFEVYLEWDGDQVDMAPSLKACFQATATKLARNTHGRFDDIEVHVNTEVDGVYQD